MEAARELEPATTSVAELTEGPFRGRYAVARKERMTARNGAAYLSLELRDRTGTIPARVFREADRLGARFNEGDAIEVAGTARRFGGELQAEVERLRRIEPKDTDPTEFLPSAYRDTAELMGFFEHLVREIHDPGLARTVEKVLADPGVAEGLALAPCTRAGHHAYLGGLLEHTVAVATLVPELCQLHPRLDSDLLMAAALLHDVGKVREFAYGARIDLSEEGRLLGHLAIGAEIVSRAAGELDAGRRLALLHCIAAHHGADSLPGRSFGSPEALALYRLNALDAGVKGALEQGIAARGARAARLRAA